MSSRLNWERAKLRDRMAKQERQSEAARTRPKFKHKPWVIILWPRPPMAPPKAYGFRRHAKCWFAYFGSREDVSHAIAALKAAGWHGTAKHTAPKSRTGGTQDRTPAPARNDRSD